MNTPSIWMLAAMMALSAACGLPQTKPEAAAIHEVRITDEVTPSLLYVKQGDEIRWRNERAEPVSLAILGTSWRDHVVCQNGFSTLGLLNDLVTIPPQQYVSLCFASPGTIHYNVWLDPNNLVTSMTPTSTIRVD